MKISKKEGLPATAGRQRPPQADIASPIGARLRFRKIPAGIYENAGTGKVIVVISDSEYYLGHIRIRNNKYKYAF